MYDRMDRQLFELYFVSTQDICQQDLYLHHIETSVYLIDSFRPLGLGNSGVQQ